MIKVRNGGITIEIPESEIDFYKRAGYSVVVEDMPIETVAPVEEIVSITPEDKNAEAVKVVNTPKAKK